MSLFGVLIIITVEQPTQISSMCVSMGLAEYVDN